MPTSTEQGYQRDIDILGFIAEEWYVTTSHIRDQFYKDHSTKSKRYLQKLKNLKKRGMLRIFQPDYSNQKIVMLNAPGIAFIEKHGFTGKYRNDSNHICPSTFYHHLAVTEARIILESLGAKDWISERFLREYYSERNIHKIPDAVFLWNGKRTSLEVEITQKKRETYTFTMANHCINLLQPGEVQQILYICNIATLCEYIKKIIAKLARRGVTTILSRRKTQVKFPDNFPDYFLFMDFKSLKSNNQPLQRENEYACVPETIMES